MFVEHEELRLERQEFEEGHFGVVRWNATLIDQKTKIKVWCDLGHHIIFGSSRKKLIPATF